MTASIREITDFWSQALEVVAARHWVFRSVRATAEARRRGDTDFVIEAEAHALAFYERTGAHRIGEVPSGSIPGRTIPLYQLEL